MTTPSWRRLVRISVADADATDSSSDDEPDILRGPPSKPKKFVRQAIVGSTQPAADHGPKKKYKGVRQRPWGKWHAELRLGSRRFHLGSFTTAYDAAVAYDLASLRLHGPNAFTNFPLGSDGTVGASTHLENDSHLERLPKRLRECGNISASPEPLKDVNSSCEKCRAVSVAPDALEIGTSVAQDRVGPDYFRYYACAVADLLSQKEDIMPCCNASRLYQGQVTCFTEKTIGGSCDGSDLFAGSSMGAWLSDFRKERLKLLLRESVRDLATEVDEVLNPVLALHQLRCRLRSKVGASSSITTGSCPKVNDDLQFLLENDSILVEEAVDKYSNELSKKLEHMERRLSKVLDTVMPTCRQMTCSEKQHLVKLIQRLPDEGLVRVAEIIQRNMPAEKLGCDEIFIDLEQQDNVTLWRLYYYVEAVRKAKMLAAQYGTQSQHHQSWNHEAIYQESNTSWR